MFQTYGNRRVLDAKVFTLLSPCEICGGKIGTGTNFNPSTSVFPALYLFLTTCFSYQEDKSVKQIAILFGNGEHKKKLRGLGPRANYTDRAAAAGRRS